MRIRYYVGIGRNLLDPCRCDGPFNSPEEAKDFLREFDKEYASPEMLEMTIIVVDDQKRTIDLYKENDQIVTMKTVQ